MQECRSAGVIHESCRGDAGAHKCTDAQVHTYMCINIFKEVCADLHIRIGTCLRVRVRVNVRVRAEEVATSTLKKESMVRVRRVHLCMDA